MTEKFNRYNCIHGCCSVSVTWSARFKNPNTLSALSVRLNGRNVTVEALAEELNSTVNNIRQRIRKKKCLTHTAAEMRELSKALLIQRNVAKTHGFRKRPERESKWLDPSPPENVDHLIVTFCFRQLPIIRDKDWKRTLDRLEWHATRPDWLRLATAS